MNKAVTALAYDRQIEAGCKAEVVKAEAALRATDAWQYLERQRQYLEVAQADVACATAEVRKYALDIYEATGHKSPHPAVKIKMYTMLEYNLAEALDYAREHLPKAVKLDKRAFERAAKAIEPDFVTVSQEPRASIARNLDKFIEKTDNEATQ